MQDTNHFLSVWLSEAKLIDYVKLAIRYLAR